MSPTEESPAFVEPKRVRVCSLSGMLGSALVLVAFFSPWVRIDPDVAKRFDAAIESSLEGPGPSRAAAGDWRRLGRIVSEQGEVSGLDVFFWARTATRTAASENTASGSTIRAVRVAAVLLAALPVLALLLFFYFLQVRCRRARSPALILSTLVGAAAIATAALYDVTRGILEAETTRGGGMSLLLAGGALLFLAGTFGVKAVNWWRVLGGSIAVGTFVVIGILSYVRGV